MSKEAERKVSASESRKRATRRTLKRDVARLDAVQVLEEDESPVVAVREKSKIRERSLGRAESSLLLRQQVAYRRAEMISFRPSRCPAMTGLTEVDEQVAPPFALSHRQRHDARDVIRRAPLLFGKVADKLGTRHVGRGHDVEEEGFNIIVERLVVEEHLGEQAQVLAVDLRRAASERESEDSR